MDFQSKIDQCEKDIESLKQNLIKLKNHKQLKFEYHGLRITRTKNDEFYQIHSHEGSGDMWEGKSGFTMTKHSLQELHNELGKFIAKLEN